MSNTMISVRTSGARVVTRDMGLGYERIHGHRRGFQTSLDFLIVRYSLTFRSKFLLTCLRDLQLCIPGNIFEVPSYLNRCCDVGLPITQEKLDYTFHRSNIHERRRLATFAGGTQERNGCSICVGLEIGIYDTDISQITFYIYSTYRNQMCILYI